MEVLGCLILFTLFEKIIGDTLYISNNASDWTTASEECKLAVPDLMYSGNRITVTLDISESIDEEIWVGYYQENVILEYFGCVEMDNHKPDLTNANPRHCIATCSAGKVIGMFDNQCFCFDKDDDRSVNNMQPYCNNVCSSRSSIVCGGFHGNTSYISLYRSLDIADGKHPAVGNGYGRCLYYDNNGLNWAECNTSYAILCEIGSDVLKGKANDGSYFFSDWTSGTVACFKNNARPASNYTSIKQIQEPFQLWTGIVRSQTIRKITDYTGHLRYAKYGYLKQKGGSYELQFADSKTNPKKSLCRNDENETPFFVGAAVGIIVSIVVLAAIVIATVLLARKRGVQFPFLKKEKQSLKTSKNNMGDAPDATSGPVEIQPGLYNTSEDKYADLDIKTTIDNERAYSVLNKASETYDYTNDYSVPIKKEDQPYDTTKSAN